MEVASNDGYLLQHFVEQRHSRSRRRAGRERGEGGRREGIPTVVKFFGRETASRTRRRGTSTRDLLVANNVLAHVPDLNDFVAGIKILLARTVA